MSSEAYHFTIIMIVLLVMSVFAMRMITALVRARAKMAEDDTYRALAERAVLAMEEQTGTINALRGELTAARTTLANVEKILKQVE